MAPRTIEELNPQERQPGNRDLPLELWWRLVDIFRTLHPVNYAEAARRAKIREATAKAAYLVGNKRLSRPPIRDIMLLEARSARTEAERKYERIVGSPNERLAAQRDAVAVRAQEGKLVHGVGIATEALLQTLLILLKNLQPIAQRIATELQILGTSGVPDKKEMWRVVREMKEFTRDIGGLVKQKLELERMLMGDPAAMTALTSDITVAQALREIDAAAKILTRLTNEPIAASVQKELAQHGVQLTLIQGGKDDGNHDQAEPERPPKGARGA